MPKKREIVFFLGTPYVPALKVPLLIAEALGHFNNALGLADHMQGFDEAWMAGELTLRQQNSMAPVRLPAKILPSDYLAMNAFLNEKRAVVTLEDLTKYAKEFGIAVREDPGPQLPKTAAESSQDQPDGAGPVQAATAQGDNQGTAHALAKPPSSDLLHKIKNRSQELDAEIELAKTKATDGNDFHSVWFALKEIALSGTSPFTGMADKKKGLEYMKANGESAWFSKNALRSRMGRSARKRTLAPGSAR